jgi:hypothetical protein
MPWKKKKENAAGEDILNEKRLCSLASLDLAPCHKNGHFP